MEMVLKICVSDGSEIIVDGFDTIGFYEYYDQVITQTSGYQWHNDRFNELMDNLVEYNYISIKRANPSDELVYRENSFAFDNGTFKENEALFLRCNSIVTIFKMY